MKRSPQAIHKIIFPLLLLVPILVHLVQPRKGLSSLSATESERQRRWPCPRCTEFATEIPFYNLGYKKLFRMCLSTAK